MPDPKTFNLAAFIAGATEETRYIDICQDRKLLAKIDHLRKTVQEKIDTGTLNQTMAGDPDERELRKLINQAKNTWLTVEITAPNQDKYRETVTDFCKANDLDPEKVLNGQGIPNEHFTNYAAFMLSHYMTHPNLPNPTDVTKFLTAIGTIQTTHLIQEFETAVATSLASLGPDAPFWRIPSPNHDGPES
ncbi:hypothetical protein [Actinobaculum massiliense]|uniref:hypothetical protein n=1 Tax=Actinobaculum massiliense TaxID=202789 RepID=UPI00071AF2F2|nr:hypothetical protein [Actinobaculum massiliense]